MIWAQMRMYFLERLFMLLWSCRLKIKGSYTDENPFSLEMNMGIGVVCHPGIKIECWVGLGEVFLKSFYSWEMVGLGDLSTHQYHDIEILDGIMIHTCNVMEQTATEKGNPHEI